MATYGEDKTVNRAWDVGLTASGSAASNDARMVAILQDIRAELQKLNGLLSCPNFTGIPRTLKKIDARLAKTRKLKAGRGEPSRG